MYLLKLRLKQEILLIKTTFTIHSDNNIYWPNYLVCDKFEDHKEFESCIIFT
jgi:hypothetical protein